MVEGGRWVMSAEEERLLQLVGDFREGKITRQVAATLGKVSTRTVSRKTRKVRLEGPAAIRHGNKNRPPCNKTAPEIEAGAMALMKQLYFDFNMRHAHDKLVEDHGLKVSYDTFVRWCRKHRVGRKKTRRPSKSRVARERMASRGMMIQMDGSTHAWNGREKWCLIGSIDDATSSVPACRFFESEDTFGTLAVLRMIVEQNGIPMSVYVDRGKAFGGLRDEEENQFRRVCEELGITVIHALSPQAKGRVERMWKTFQDRLIPELRLAGIRTMAAANEYLEKDFLPKYWRIKNEVPPASDENRYKVLDPELNLDEIFCKKYRRRLQSGHLFNFRGGTYLVKSPTIGSMKGAEISIHERADGSWSVYYGIQRLKFTPWHSHRKKRLLLKAS